MNFFSALGVNPPKPATPVSVPQPANMAGARAGLAQPAPAPTAAAPMSNVSPANMAPMSNLAPATPAQPQFFNAMLGAQPQMPRPVAPLAPPTQGMTASPTLNNPDVQNMLRQRMYGMGVL